MGDTRYRNSEQIWFPVSNRDRRYHPKEEVIGLELDGGSKAYPFAELSRRDSPFADRIAPDGSRGESGNEIPTVIVYWFAWTAFHPDTEVFEGK